MNPSEFSAWFKTQEQRLARIEAPVAAEEIGAKLEAVDERLSVEIADLDDGKRELIIGASRHQLLFQLVEGLCADLASLSQWRLQALKPARGFDFELQFGDVTLRAGDLRFEPLRTDDLPGELGLRLFAPEEIVRAVGDAAWLILETGIGERAAAALARVDVVPLPPQHAQYLALTALQKYLGWAASRRGDSQN